jgi:hypothetical protein
LEQCTNQSSIWYWSLTNYVFTSSSSTSFTTSSTISFVASHVHSPQLPKNTNPWLLNQDQAENKWPTISVSFDSYETSAYTIKSFPLKLEDSVRMITFNDMHVKIPKSEEKKFVDAYLIKDRAIVLEGSAQRQTTSHKNMTFSFILFPWWHLFDFETHIFLDN